MNKPSATIIGSIPKLSAKHVNWLLPLILSCIMSAVISLVNLIRNLGWVENFWALWFSAWILSWVIAYPIVLFMLPIARKITAIFVDVKPAP